MKTHSVVILSPPQLETLATKIGGPTTHRDEEIRICAHEFHDLDSFKNYLEIEEEPDTIIVFDMIHGLGGDYEKARSKTLECLKTIKYRFNSRIIIIINSKKEQESILFINALMSLSIHDFHLVDKISNSLVLHWILSEPKQWKDNAKYLNTDITRKVIIKEVEKAVPVVEYVPTQAPEKKGTMVIGVIGAARGQGATTLCVNYADYLTQLNQRVLLLDRTTNQHMMKCVESSFPGLEIKDIPLHDVKMQNYDYVIVDFSPIAEISTDGNISLTEEMISDRRMDRQYCEEIVLVASCLPWRLHEIYAYINGDIFEGLTEAWILYANGPENNIFGKAKKKIRRETELFVPHEHSDEYAALDKLIENRRA